VLFARSGELIIELCRSAVKYDGKKCGGVLTKIADTEEEAYLLMQK